MTERAASPSRPPGSDEIDLTAWFVRFGRRWRLSAVVVLLCVLAAAAYGYTRPRTFVASVQLMAAAGASSYTATEPDAVPGVVSDLWSGARVRSNLTHAAAIRSPEVLQKALDSLPARERQVFTQHGSDPDNLPVEVSAPLNTDMVEVRVTAESREAALALANAVAKVYADATREMSVQLAGKGWRALEPERQLAQRRVAQAERLLLERQSASRVFDPTAELKSATDRLSLLRANLSDARVELAAVTRQVSVTRQLRDRMARQIVMSSRDKRSAKADELDKGVADLELARAKAGAVYGDGAPQVARLDSQIRAARKAQAAAPQTVPSEERRDANPTWLAMDQQLAETLAEQASLQQKARALQAELGTQAAWLERLSEEEGTQGRLREAVTSERDSYASVVRQLGMLRASAPARLPTIAQLGPASAPRKGTRGLVPLVFTGLMCGLVLAVALSMALDLQEGSRALRSR